MTINFKGEASYNTNIGGIFTIIVRLLILVIGILSLIDLVRYKDPKVVEYTVYENREDDEEFNFSELHGNMVFSLFNSKTGKNEQLDPRFGNFILGTDSVEVSGDDGYVAE